MGNARQKWRQEEIARHDKRVTYREYREMKKDEKKEEEHRRESNMEIEGLRQMLMGATISNTQERRDIAKDSAEIRQLEREMGQMSIQVLEIATTI